MLRSEVHRILPISPLHLQRAEHFRAKTCSQSQLKFELTHVVEMEVSFFFIPDRAFLAQASLFFF